MALPLPPGLTPSEIAFLCEMELVTIIPRQRLEALALLSGPLKPLVPPQRASVPLWHALLLKRQRRANIVPPPWLSPESLTAILEDDTHRGKPQDDDANRGFLRDDDAPKAATFSPPPRPPPPASANTLVFSPPFLPSSTADAPADALPYHWLEMGEMLLEAAADDFDDPDAVRKLLRGLREVRIAKLRQNVQVLDAAGAFEMTGVGAMEIGEARSFITGVIDGLRKISASREQQRKDREREERENGYPGTGDYDDDEMDMQ